MIPQVYFENSIRKNSVQKYTNNNHVPQTTPHSKDRTIQRLIQQNIFLKRQLSQLLQKHDINSQYSKPSGFATQASASSNNFINQFNNSFERRNTVHEQKNHLKTQSCEYEVSNRNKRQQLTINRRRNPFERCSINQELDFKNRRGNEFLQNQAENIRFPDNFTKTPIYSILNLSYQNFNQNQHNINNSSQAKNTQRQPDSLNEQELYREKIYKLKIKKNFEPKRISNDKLKNQPQYHSGKYYNLNQTVNHSIKHSKSPSNHSFFKAEKQFDNNTLTKISNFGPNQSQFLSLPSKIVNNEIVNCHQTANSAHQRNQFIYLNKTQQKNNINEHKKLAKFIPKDFSKQKIIKTVSNEVKIIPRNNLSNLQQFAEFQSFKSSFLKEKFKNEGPKFQQKKISINELRGRVYLNEDGEGNRTKRLLSKSINTDSNGSKSKTIKYNEQQNGQKLPAPRNKPKQNGQEEKKRISAVSKMTLIEKNVFQTIQPIKASNNMMKESNKASTSKKSCNKIYLLEEEENNKQIEKQTSRKQSSDSKKILNGNEYKNRKDAVSIEQLHMIPFSKVDNRIVNQQFNSSVQQDTYEEGKQPIANNNLTNRRNTRIIYHQVYYDQNSKDF